MSRSVVFIISLLSLAIFAGLVYYGWTYRWGGPSDAELSNPIELTMPRMEHALKLEPSAFDDGVWKELSPVTVRLLHQVTVVPHGENLVQELEVRAFHNGNDAFFLLEWDDGAESRVHDVAKFPDAVAIAFSLAEEAPSSSIMMGFESPVNMWQWKANLDAQFWRGAVPEGTFSSNSYYTYEDQAAFPVRKAKLSSACQDIVADRPGALTLKEKTGLSGRGQWRDGKWRVILTRALRTEDREGDVQLDSGKVYVALAVWNGEKGDRGSRKSISDWIIIDMDPSAVRSGERLSLNVHPFSLLPPAYAEEAGPSPGTGQPRVITIKAKRFEFMPNQIRVRRDELVTIRLESLDVTHGFYLDGYGIQLKTNPTEVAKATFIADKTGRFTFRCSETCGEFHPYMVGYLTVEPNTQFRVFAAATFGGCVVLAAVFAFRKRGVAV